MNIKKQLRIEYKSHIERNLGLWEAKLGSLNAAHWRLRNAAIDDVCRNWEQSQPYQLFEPKVYKDIATSQTRADHYGVSVGDTIRTYRKTRSDYTHQKAKFKAHVRSTAVELSLILVNPQ